MSKKNYCEGKWFDASEGRKHLAHVFRLKSQIKNPKIYVLGDQHDSDYFLTTVASKTRPAKNYFYELMAYIQDDDKIIDMINFLKENYHRDVTAVVHDDESHRHVHFLLKNQGADGKSLRLQLSDFRAMNAKAAELAGREMAVKGSGRQKIPMRVVKADPQILEREKAHFEEQKKQINAVCEFYNNAGVEKIEISALNRQKGIMPIQMLGTDANLRENVNLRRLNAMSTAGEEIVFKPLDPVHRVIYLDDVPRSKLSDYQNSGFIVETSANKYQVHAMADNALDDKLRLAVQRALAVQSEADTGSISQNHYRKMPGFTNNKYAKKPMVRIVNYAKSIQDIAIKPIIELYKDIKALRDKYNPQKGLKILSNIHKTKNIKTWQDFATGDDSVTDMRYVVYLIAQDVDSKEITERLLAESKDILLRKKGNVMSYITRTIARANEYLYGKQLESVALDNQDLNY